MTDKDDHPSLKDKFPIDEDYIDVETRRADVSTTEEDPDGVDFSAVEGVSSEHTDMSHTYWTGDASGGSGTAWDHEIDENAPQEHDGRASTRTGFDPYDSTDPEKWKRLVGYQEALWSGENQYPGQGREVDQRRFINMFSSRLGLTPYQHDRCLAIAEGVNFGHMAHYSTEMVVLAIISLVANEDGRWIRDEEQFKSLCRDVGASMKNIRSCRRLVRKKSEVMG